MTAEQAIAIFVVVGTRAVPPLEAAGQAMTEVLSMPTSLTLDRIILFYHHDQSNVIWQPCRSNFGPWMISG